MNVLGNFRQSMLLDGGKKHITEADALKCLAGVKPDKYTDRCPSLFTFLSLSYDIMGQSH